MLAAHRVLVIDSHDSFTYNLVEDLRRLGVEPTVVRYDAPGSVRLEDYQAIILSPGPGRPEFVGGMAGGLAGAAERDIRAAALASGLPVLGVCLGHQFMAVAEGGTVAQVPPAHGEQHRIVHHGRGIFAGLPQQLSVVRYHSLAITELPPNGAVEVTARAADGTIMAIAHRSRPWWGVQFHPESISSQGGRRILANFLQRAGMPRVQRRKLRVPRVHHPEQVFHALYGDCPTAVWLDDATGSGWSLMAGRSADGRGNGGGDARAPSSGMRVVAATVLRGEQGSRGQGRAPGTSVTLCEEDSAGHRAERRCPDFFAWLERNLAETGALAEEQPGNLGPGWLGYLGYELGAPERSSARTLPPASGSPEAPDALLFFAPRVVLLSPEGDLYAAALDGLEDVASWAEERLAEPLPEVPRPGPRVHLREQYGEVDYRRRIARLQDAIRAGESYEACLTTQLRGQGTVGFGEYCALRASHGTPRGCYLRHREVQLLSVSPESFLSVRGGVASSRPIKGTRPVSCSARELRENPKDTAENRMIVDLVRHDLAQVAVPGSVRVPDIFTVETYSTVHQLVSTVEAPLAPDHGVADAVRALFPGGSMTGAPKERTMELLAEVEDCARGPYSGAVGLLGSHGGAELSMVIRTVVSCGDQLSYGVGGAILHRSDVAAEYQEVKDKCRVLREIAELDFPR